MVRMGIERGSEGFQIGIHSRHCISRETVGSWWFKNVAVGGRRRYDAECPASEQRESMTRRPPAFLPRLEIKEHKAKHMCAEFDDDTRRLQGMMEVRNLRRRPQIFDGLVSQRCFVFQGFTGTPIIGLQSLSLPQHRRRLSSSSSSAASQACRTIVNGSIPIDWNMMK